MTDYFELILHDINNDSLSSQISEVNQNEFHDGIGSMKNFYPAENHSVKSEANLSEVNFVQTGGAGGDEFRTIPDLNECHKLKSSEKNAVTNRE